MAADDRFNALGGAFDYMMQTGYLFGGWHLGRSAIVAESLHSEGERTAFCERKMATAAFYGARILPRCDAHAGAINQADSTLTDFAVDWL